MKEYERIVAQDRDYRMLFGEASVLASDHTGIQRPRLDGLENPELKYRVVDVKLPMLYKWCRDAMLEDFDHNYGRPETEEQIRIVAEKFSDAGGK